MRSYFTFRPGQPALQINLTWPARVLMVLNTTRYPLYGNLSGSGIPDNTSYDIQIAPGTSLVVPVYGPSYRFQFGKVSGSTLPKTLAKLDESASLVFQDKDEVAVPTVTGSMLPFPPNYYDRKPIVIPLQYQGQVGPHAVTPRFTYTVPVNRLAFIEWAFTVILRVGMATGLALVQASVIYQDHLAVQAVLASAIIWQTGVGATDQASGNGYGLMVTGDSVFGQTLDLSPDGSCLYNLTAKVCEFDA